MGLATIFLPTIFLPLLTARQFLGKKNGWQVDQGDPWLFVGKGRLIYELPELATTELVSVEPMILHYRKQFRSSVPTGLVPVERMIPA